MDYKNAFLSRTPVKNMICFFFYCQAHMQARYVILQVLLEVGQGLVNLKKTEAEDGKADIEIELERAKIKTVGKDAIGNFLKRLQVG